ncbi:PHP domain-containing protein [Millisia brevis]|uniref:PHP domain-containing protein n=1 Tax=Millisia brevis TaxID=264148 RepID=UPI00082D9758|nr:PHP domain-containing protein [Millisia brevis]
MLIDLHSHSTASDGTDTPGRVVALAAADGIDVIALTDHDTVAGWDDATAAAERLPDIALVRGMEMSCVGDGQDGRPVSLHLLAYLFDPDQPDLAAERDRVGSDRPRRLRRMAELMRDDGLPVDPDDLPTDNDSIGRPHLAGLLVRAGVVDSLDEAFRRYLRSDGPYHVAKAETPLDEAVALVRRAGGVSVLAHGRAARRGRLLATEHIERLAAAGALDGVEVDHPDHDASDAAELRDLAERYDLVVTGSSDYHGANKTTPLGARTTAPEQYRRLVERAHGVAVIGGRG